MEQQNQIAITPDLLASHGQRFLNLIVDTFVQVLLFFVVLVVVEAVKGPAVSQAFQNYVLVNPIGQYTFVSSIALLYYNISEVIFARSVGKLLTKTKVVDSLGMPPNHQMIMMRSICRLIPFNSFSFLGLIPRGWHDKLSKTYVVSITLLEEKRREVQSSKNNFSEE
jgi:uncharacterized RDD family membrane protein YckC